MSLVVTGVKSRSIDLVDSRFYNRSLDELLKLLDVKVADTNAPNTYDDQDIIFELRRAHLANPFFFMSSNSRHPDSKSGKCAGP